MILTARELRERLDLVDGDCEIVIHDSSGNYYNVQEIGLNPYYEDITDNNEIPFCISVK